MRSLVAPVAALTAVLVLGCNAMGRDRYEVVAGGGTLGNLVFRVDHQSGEVRAFRWWPAVEPQFEGDEGQAEGFGLAGCAQ